MSELSQLPNAEKAKRYLQLASEARREARRSPAPIREAYLAIATHWEALATLSQLLADRSEAERSDRESESVKAAAALRSPKPEA